jgi:hypothetical protein
MFVLGPGTSFPPRSWFFCCQLLFHLCLTNTFISTFDVAQPGSWHHRCIYYKQRSRPVMFLLQQCVELRDWIQSKSDVGYAASCQALHYQDHLHFGRQQFLSATRLFNGVLYVMAFDPQAVLFNNVTPARPVAGFICRLSLYMRPCKNVETTTDRFN